MLALLKFSLIPVLCMAEDIQKFNDFHRRAVKTNGIAIAWDVLVVCERETKLEVVNHPTGFRFVSPKRRDDEKIWQKVVELNPEIEFHIDFS